MDNWLVNAFLERYEKMRANEKLDQVSISNMPYQKGHVARSFISKLERQARGKSYDTNNMADADYTVNWAKLSGAKGIKVNKEDV